MACSRPPSQCEPKSLPPGPPTGRRHLPFSRRRREMSSNKEQRSAVFVILFALITILILYSSNSANEVFHYGSLRGRSRRPVNLKKWSITEGYVPILGNKTLPSRCHQCVIISSSSHLLGTKLGPEIERAECTIRMNDAPTTGYSADVGNKTTYRVVAHSSVFRVLRRPQEFVNRTPETVFIFWGPPNKMQKPQGSLVRVIQRAGLVFPNMEAYAVSPGRMQQFDDLFRGETGKDREKSHSWLSTGWFTMVIAVELCDHVHVYGMVPPNYCSGPASSACPTTTMSPRGRTNVSPTSRMSTAARATTTALSPRKGSSRRGPSCMASPSPTPRGPKPPSLWDLRRVRGEAASAQPLGQGPPSGQSKLAGVSPSQSGP
ncbi:alpha-N-acetylgalactosaminide alpha-2,6-sialyltransferase 6 isoform X1 [Piliocolobus tephrosceles]|uniref:Alpha-N-acetylgalactosaminide alpha-2,6-sialyltransferase 6 n=2 Tax=Piliocolobus tephrosceles TaxID=591936 RepID=A0A8C9H636_9PRIM|nr:alpha-N-acetylgalactosaminide alpha-2,6-sialyltransferase 6 isoform X1 [Piliocolobus tephrosceles]XP_026312928.1 alpha-N-acetylgalactosaminide alpha-2,6-sialyltransferase 6 isoform X1 [Piliocolobus tephrosceles]XP_026312929.1 alpha-N-acetylgalactosaminide alpha-2,6-sialyltransferase 6 isoform X1 [Piliocolobus tephrosceles]XP_026312930.1 alpha-N-acetylgalactosaminide alpha-2,6-sialyltransferase 6 isoform X1 [Piliocolobus tephrosceles]XP_026312931.1 alpha-N-acetylgalactosaminide alpha-2,6-sial